MKVFPPSGIPSAGLFTGGHFLGSESELDSISPDDPRLSPGYYAYYHSQRRLDPRLPPPLVLPPRWSELHGSHNGQGGNLDDGDGDENEYNNDDDDDDGDVGHEDDEDNLRVSNMLLANSRPHSGGFSARSNDHPTPEVPPIVGGCGASVKNACRFSPIAISLFCSNNRQEQLW